MPVVTLDELKMMRKKAGLTQQELALKSGVSQSMIARIESQDINPTLATVNRIYDTIRNEESAGLLVKSIMTRGVVGIGRHEPVKKAIEIMKKHKISQLPVLEKNDVVGSITDDGIIAKLNRQKDKEAFKALRVEQVMEPAFPEVSEETGINTIATLLEKHPALIVKKSNRITGIICSSDLFDAVV